MYNIKHEHTMCLNFSKLHSHKFIHLGYDIIINKRRLQLRIFKKAKNNQLIHYYYYYCFYIMCKRDREIQGFA